MVPFVFGQLPIRQQPVGGPHGLGQHFLVVARHLQDGHERAGVAKKLPRRD